MNPVSKLNELRQGLVYHLTSRTGADHEPVFTVTVEVDDQNYVGEGRSKKLARFKAAEAALLVHNTNQTPQNATVALDELSPGLVYKLKSRSGPDHEPIFTVTVEVDGRQCVGQGRSKRLAREKAAEAALNIVHSRKHTLQLDGTETLNHLFCLSTPEPQNPVTILNEVRPGLVYSLKDRTGTDHEPIFTVAVEVDGKTYVGRGKSQKLSRMQAAEAALRKLITSGKVPAPAEDFSGPTYSLDSQNALARLNELCPGLVYNLDSRTGSDHAPVFKMTVEVGGEKYVGKAKSKKLARIQAAEAALRKLNKLQDCSSVVPDIEPAITKKNYELAEIVAKGIFKLVLERFFKATATKNFLKYRKYKVLAGIVMTENLDLSTAKVISVATGTKCIEGKYMSRDGTRLNDSHAEIVARRCLIEFLYGQLELHKIADTAKDSIFVRASQPSDQLYKLKGGIQFHLFIDTAPCGDARIFSPDKTVIRIDKHPNRIARGLLRTKIEGGEGTIPVKNGNYIQTWNEVMGGRRLLTMSCSDKIARWNVVGVQGALLSTVMQPIYFYSIVLGSTFHPDHIYRAVCGRIEPSIQSRLPLSYSLNTPKFALVTSTDVRNEINAPKFGINWIVNDKMVEVLDLSTGRTVFNKVSRLSKRNFFSRYANLIKQLPNVHNERSITGDYSETKRNAHDYQMAKGELFATLSRQRLGNWVKKPIELDAFGLFAYQPNRNCSELKQSSSHCP